MHAPAVTGLDISVRRPLLATCSNDRSVRLWNYAERSCDLVKIFADDLYSVAIHPSGLQVRDHITMLLRAGVVLCSL